MTLQRFVSAHAAAAAGCAGYLQARANAKSCKQLGKAGSSCIERLGPSPATPGSARSVVYQSCSDIAVKRERERERDEGQMTGRGPGKFWP